MNELSPLSRRGFISAGVTSAAIAGALATTVNAAETATKPIVTPPAGKKILLSCKLGMVAREAGGKKLSLAERLAMAGEAGFDGVDLDQAAECTPEQARQ